MFPSGNTERDPAFPRAPCYGGVVTAQTTDAAKVFCGLLESRKTTDAGPVSVTRPVIVVTPPEVCTTVGVAVPRVAVTLYGGVPPNTANGNDVPVQVALV